MAQLIIFFVLQTEDTKSLKGVQRIQMIITQTYNIVYSKHSAIATHEAQIWSELVIMQ